MIKKQIAYELAEDIVEKIIVSLPDEGIDMETVIWDKEVFKENLIEIIIESLKEYGVI
jgi:arginyl-tRNA synthetase